MSLRLVLRFSLLALALVLSPAVADLRGGIDPDGLKLADAGDHGAGIDPDGATVADDAGDSRGTIDPDGAA